MALFALYLEEPLCLFCKASLTWEGAVHMQVPVAIYVGSRSVSVARSRLKQTCFDAQEVQCSDDITQAGGREGSPQAGPLRIFHLSQALPVSLTWTPCCLLQSLWPALP